MKPADEESYLDWLDYCYTLRAEEALARWLEDR